MSADKFLEQWGSSDFKSLLDKAEPELPPWRKNAPPDPRPPAEQQDSQDQSADALDSELEMKTGIRQAEEDARTLLKLQEEDADTEAEEDAQTLLKLQQAHGKADSKLQPDADGKRRRTDSQLEEEEAKRKALHLYRVAHSAVYDAAGSSDAAATDDAYWAAEHALATEYRTRWQDRGPRGSDAPTVWRNQLWRAGSQRYGNRGGNPAKNAFFAEQARKKGEEAKAKSKDKGKSKGKSQGKGKGSDTGKGSNNQPDRFLVFTNRFFTIV